MFNLPNWITLVRIACVPILVILLYFPGPAVCFISMLVFALASLTDYIDGRLARSRGEVTNLGKLLDPLADKLLVCSVLVMLVYLGWAPAWIVIIIIARELMVTGVRAVAADLGVVIAADRWGKMKTIFQLIALHLLVLHYPVLGFDPRPLGMVALYLALILTVVSGTNYLYDFYLKCLKK
jgi:CDP-diacylglycerol--glycerol-3-phosphate 3-phosphatidyltransferase